MPRRWPIWPRTPGSTADLPSVPAVHLRSPGCITAHGLHLGALGEAVEQGLPCPVQEAPEGRAISLPPSGWIEPVPRPEAWGSRRSSRRLRFGRLDRLSRLSLIAAHHAALTDPPPEDDDRSTVALGTAFGSHLSNERFQQLLEREGRSGVSPALFTYTLPSSATGEISIHFALKGGATTFTEGEVAGLTALAHAAGEIQRGRTRWALAGAVDVLSPTLLRALSRAGRPPLAEAAALFTLGTGAEGALARIAGAGQAFGPGAAQQAAARALELAGITESALAARLTFSPAAPAPSPLQVSAGRCLAALPLLGLGLHLTRRGRRGLPALVLAEDPSGAAAALCLTASAPHG